MLALPSSVSLHRSNGVVGEMQGAIFFVEFEVLSHFF